MKGSDFRRNVRFRPLAAVQEVIHVVFHLFAAAGFGQVVGPGIQRDTTGQALQALYTNSVILLG